MSNNRIPSSLEGIKRLAKKIRRQSSVPHTQALDVASRTAGFENFTHARKQLAQNGVTTHSPDRFDDFLNSNRAKWTSVVESVNPDTKPQIVWTGFDEIRRALIPFMGDNFNHAHLPTGGGQDYNTVSAARERDCLEFSIDYWSAHIVRPEKLVLETIQSHPEESFLLLELANLEKSGAYDELYRSYDDEDWRRYESWRREDVLDVYGEYFEREYWDRCSLGQDENGDDIPLPEDARTVVRWMNGKILFVSKGSLWNSIPATYDGRHDRMTSSEIRKFIEYGIHLKSQILDAPSL